MPVRLLEERLASLVARPWKWLITGSAGFIGSHLLEVLLKHNQNVVSIDNFSTGHSQNLEEVRQAVGEGAWARHEFVKADIRDASACSHACRGVDVVLHQAALGSVPRSIEDPLGTNESNVTGFLNMLAAARNAGVRRFLFASSSSVYGDDARLPKREDRVGRCLSPYAVSKKVDEIYADVFADCYGIETVGFRYFNVFGARQDPEGPYAAVIPRWIAAFLAEDEVGINGDGETTRDFCYIANVVEANLLAATADNAEAVNQVYNVAYGGRTSLNTLFSALRSLLGKMDPRILEREPTYRSFRAGDVRHSEADIGKARQLLGYDPQYDLYQGLEEAIEWYVRRFAPARNSEAAHVR